MTYAVGDTIKNSIPPALCCVGMSIHPHPPGTYNDCTGDYFGIVLIV